MVAHSRISGGLSGAGAAGFSLLLNEAASAHTDHYKTEPSEAEPSKEETGDTSTEEPKPASPASNNAANDTIQTIPAAQPDAEMSSTNFLGNFSIGPAESLLGLMIAGPMILTILKKQFQP